VEIVRQIEAEGLYPQADYAFDQYEIWAFSKVVRLKKYGRKRLVIMHEKPDLSDSYQIRINYPLIAPATRSLGYASKVRLRRLQNKGFNQPGFGIRGANRVSESMPAGVPGNS
jgi:hypothetical protein